MRITQISCRGFLTLLCLDLPLEAPVTLVAGPNGAGKSSLRDALRFAFFGQPGRVRLKKDFPALLTDRVGYSGRGTVRVETDAGTFARNVRTGNPEGACPEPPEALACVLDADRFAQLDPGARRRLLLALAGTTLDRDEIRRRLLARECFPDHVDAILPLLRQGFEAAAQEAAGRAREAKGAWRELTGQHWGTQKGETWRPEPLEGKAPPYEEDQPLSRELRELKERLVALEAARRAREQAQRYREQAARAPELRQSVAALEEQARQAEARLQELQARSGGVLDPLACPECGAQLHLLCDRGRHRWAQAEPADAAPDPQALQEAEQTLRRLRQELDLAKAGLAAAERAEAQLQALQEAAGETPGDESPERLRTRIAALEGELRRRDELRHAWVRHQQDALRARDLHSEILAWLRLAEALSGDGIPAELAREALEPINARLRETAGATGWPLVQIDQAMEITARGPAGDTRPYGLLSESERWRADAAIAEAISGLQLLVLDRLDVLDLPGRAQAIRWLAGLGRRGTQVLAMATLKACPDRLPEGVRCVWLERGGGLDLKPESGQEAA